MKGYVRSTERERHIQARSRELAVIQQPRASFIRARRVESVKDAYIAPVQGIFAGA